MSDDYTPDELEEARAAVEEALKHPYAKYDTTGLSIQVVHLRTLLDATAEVNVEDKIHTTRDPRFHAWLTKRDAHTLRRLADRWHAAEHWDARAWLLAEADRIEASA